MLDLLFETNGFHTLIKSKEGNMSITLLETSAEAAMISPLQVNLVHLASPTQITSATREALKSQGWQIEEHFSPFPNLQPKSTVLVIDELSSPVLATIDAEQWRAIQDLTSQEHRILWVTAGSQFQVSQPDNALIYGLARTMRAEDPLLSFVVLDLESRTSSRSITCISRVLESIVKPIHGDPMETEFVERGGVIYVNRVRPDEKISPPEKKDDSELQNRDLHESQATINFRCERVGAIDSLVWAEVAEKELTLRDDMVEVEIVAAGLNFKVSMLILGSCLYAYYRAGSCCGNGYCSRE